MPEIIIQTDAGSYTFRNDTVENVGQLLELAAPTLGINPQANVTVNGAAATAETPVTDGDRVATTKPAGNKGI